jgi:hypothetical protein
MTGHVGVECPSDLSHYTIPGCHLQPAGRMHEIGHRSHYTRWPLMQVGRSMAAVQKHRAHTGERQRHCPIVRAKRE